MLCPTDKLCFVVNSILKEVDPVTGARLRSLGGQSLLTRATPIVSDGYLWVYNGTGSRCCRLVGA
jgi:hypothetical protein